MPNEKTQILDDNNENSTLLIAGSALTSIRNLEPDGQKIPIAIIPPGYEVHDLDADSASTWLDKPRRKTGDFTFADSDSFIRYFNEHQTEDSRIFAHVTDTGGRFSGTLNFHGKDPSWNDHECHFELRSTREWRTWLERHGKKMSQGEFATFLEENADMFDVPQGADLLELITNLEGHANASINTAVKMQTGAIKLAYTEEVELKGGSASQAGELAIPAILEVGIAPFEGVARYRIKARLRYRIENRKVVFWYESVDTHLVVRQVCAEIIQIIEKQTGVVPFKQ